MATLPVKIDAKQAKLQLRSLEKQYDSFAKSVEKSQKNIKAQQSALSSLAKAAAGYFAVTQAVDYVNYLSNISDQYTLIEAKIKLIAKTEETYADARERLLDLSKETGTTLSANAQAFAKLGNSMKGAAQDDVINYLETVNKSLIVSGATTQEATGFMIQFAQAMGSGVVNGDELRTMNEANSYLMAKIADQFNTNIAGLKEMGAANILTTEKFAEALATVANSVEEDYANIPVTIARAWNEVNEIWKNAIVGGDSATQSTQMFVQSIQSLGKVIEDNIGGIQKLFTVSIEGASFLIEQVGALNTLYRGMEAAGRGEMSYWDALTGTTSEVRKQLEGITTETRVIAGFEERILYVNQQIASLQSVILNSTGDTTKLRERLELLRQQKQSYVDTIDYIKDTEIEVKVNAKVVDELASIRKTQRKWIAGWLSENEAAYKKTIKTLESELKKLESGASFNIDSSELDLAEDIRSIQREGLSAEAAWRDLNNQIDEYKAQAAQAAESGDWKKTLDYLERAESLVRGMSTQAETRIVTDAEVENARKIWEYQQRITRGGKSAYGTAAKAYNEARQNYAKLLDAQKKGSIEVVSAEEKRRQKVEELQKIHEKMEEARSKGADTVKQELEEHKALLEAYRSGNVAEIEGLEITQQKLEEKKETVESTQQSWVKYGDKVISVQSNIQKTIQETNAELNKQISLLNKAGSSTAASGLSGRETGGSVNAGQSYIVGEKGREIFTPSTAGFIIPNHMSQGAGSDNRVAIDMNFGGGNVVSMSGEPMEVAKLQRLVSEKKRYAS